MGYSFIIYWKNDFMRITKIDLFLLATLSVLSLPGCTPSTQWQTSPTQQQSRADRDMLSYGTASQIKKGVTTQEEIVRNFGAPNITTNNAAGNEVWVYDRISTETQQDGWSEANRFQQFLGIPLYPGTAGMSAQQSSSKYGGGRSSRSSTLTVIIDFDKSKRVSDYAVRATQF
jgi:outer membrane protein assembly factor BamE (lipoprotein component of BamABCDE complex)